ncbi:MAG: PD-(D/E)XK nuclease family protein [Actinobacteria bacterium]|nr:PD-(D/E)XK nuclease family protein [Actinomycetota bacterium]
MSSTEAITNIADLNPIQRSVFDALRVPDGWNPLPDSLVEQLETELVTGLQALDTVFTRDEPLRVTKRTMATIHGCETHHVEEKKSAFAWSLPSVRGTVAHKAIELLLNWRGDPVPAHLADAAVDSLINNPRESAGNFLAQLPDSELAELRGMVVDTVTNYLESFPPLKPQWRPVVEHSARYTLFDESIVFSSRADLVIGTAGRKVLIDLKTGQLTPTHRDDLRFYALVETLRSRQAPRSLASFSLDAARLDVEEVSEGLLRAAVRRTIDGVTLMADLVTERREPTRRAGSQCRWCPLNDSCDEGVRFLARASGDDD